MAKPKENIPTLTLTPLNFKEGKLKSNPQEKPMDVGDAVSKYDPTIYCRTCANADPCLVPIFKEEGLDYKLDKKIEKYLPIRVSEKDDLSVHICYHCASTLIAWDSLIEGCVQAEKKLTSLKNSFKSKESEEVEEGGELVIDEIDSDDEPLITKKLASENAGVGEKRDILQEKNDFQGLLEPVNAEPQRLVEEPDLSFSNYQHQFSVYRLLYLEIFSVRIESIFCCHVCNVLEKLRMRVKKSLTSVNDKQVDKGSVEMRSEPANERLELVTEQVLLVEDRLETVKNGLEPDKKQLEPGKENLEVFVPPLELFKERLELMKKHLKLRRKRLQPKVEMICEHCGKVLRNRRTWKSHLRAHSIKKQCHQCGKVFNCSFNLSRHMKVVHEGLKEHQCKYCGRRYRTRSEMEDHEMVHKRSVEKIVCEDCGRMCVNKASFYSHKKLHRGTKPSVEKSLFYCEECRKTFTTKKSKVEHMLIHTGEKPINCSYCNKKFRTKKAIEQHMPIHTGEKPFVCEECGKAFKRKDHLRVHVRSHTGEKPYTCEYCGKGTTQLTDMKKHIKTHVKPV